MWCIWVNIENNTWLAVAGGYADPTAAAKDIDSVRQEWPMADAFMIGMEVWKADDV